MSATTEYTNDLPEGVTSPITSAIASFRPRPVTPTVTTAARGQKLPELKWRLGDIANRNEALILVVVPNPKQSGDAQMMYPWQGEPGSPTVTVAQYLSFADRKGKMGALGTARMRSDLIWNLNKHFVKLVDRNGNELHHPER